MTGILDRLRRLANPSLGTHADDERDGDDRFLVDDAVQVLGLLQRMVDQRALVDIALGDSRRSLLTAVVAVEPARVVLDAAPDAALERLALQQAEVRCSSRIDRVEVRFTLGPLQRIQWDGLPAYAAALPSRLRYMQRREFFRIDVPVAHAVQCKVLVPASDEHPPHEFRTRVNDISMGGLSLLVPPGEESVITGGARLTCRLTLPDTEPVMIGLRVRRLFRAGHRSGVGKSCAGCEFVDLSASAETAVQRYMRRLERERIVRERGEL